MDQNYQLFTLMSRIEGMSNQFTKTDWKIVQYIKNHTISFIELSAQELAGEIGTSDASIIRFSQKVGFTGLNELKYTMQKELEKSSSSANHSEYATLMNDTKMLIDSLFDLTNPNDINYLREKMMIARRIFIVGLDFNKNVAEIIAHKFMMLGFTVQALTNYDTLKLYRSLSKAEDLFITISLSGNHKVLSSILADFIQNDSKVVLVSNYEKSLCAVYADLTFLIPKTNMLRSSNSISRELLILMLFDMIFQSFLSEETEIARVFQKTATFAQQGEGEESSARSNFIELL